MARLTPQQLAQNNVATHKSVGKSDADARRDVRDLFESHRSHAQGRGDHTQAARYSEAIAEVEYGH